MSWLKTTKHNNTKRNSLFGISGIYVFLIEDYPKNRLCPGYCKEHRIEIEDKFLHLKYTNSIKESKEFVYTLTQKFNDGILKINLDEKIFNNILLNLNNGSIAIKSQKKMIINNSFIVPIHGYYLEKRY